MTEYKEFKPDTIQDVPVVETEDVRGDVLYNQGTAISGSGGGTDTIKKLSSNSSVYDYPASSILRSANFVTGSSGWQIDGKGSAEFQNITAVGSVTATSGAIGGWDIVAGYIYSLQSGTPTSSPTDGVVMASGNEGIIVYEDAAKRVEVGYLSAGVYGLKVYDGGGSNVIFEASDTQTIVAGWTFDNTYLYGLTSGTPTSSPTDGMVLKSGGDSVITVYEDAGKRVELGYLSAGVYGLKGYNTDGSTVSFELSDTQQMIAGWVFDETYFYGLASGTPTSSPNDGVVLKSGSTGGMIVYENTEKRAEMGYLSAGIYGFKAYADDGSTVIFEASDTQQMIGGYYFTDTLLTTDTTTANANVLIDAGNSLMRLGPTTGDYITMDGANQKVESSNYVSGFAGAGFTLQPDLLEVGNIACRGILRTYVLQKDILSVHAGSLIVAPNADVLDADMTALDASPLVIKGTATFAVGDILRIKDGTDDEWMTVTNIGSAPSYTVTRDEASGYAADSNPTWQKGAAVTNYGQSGDGGLYLTASDTNNPYLSIFDHAGSPWSTINTRLRLGNLNGYLGYSSDIYGLGIGDSGSGNANMTFDNTNGIRMRSGTNSLFSVDNSGNALIAGWNIVDGYIYNLQSGTPTSSPSDGLVLASGNEAMIIYEDTAKRLEVGYLSAGVYGIKGYDTGGSNVLFEISDTQALLAGWTINQNTLANSTNIILDANNKAISINDATFGNSGIQLQYNSGTPRMYAGDGADQFLEYDGTNLTLNNSPLALQDMFGDGSDGTATISSNTALTADAFYDDLTINSSIILDTAGYRLFVKGTLTVNGTIQRTPNAGGNGTNGTTGGADAAGGAAGAALAAGSIPGGTAGQVGSYGGDRQASGSGTSGDGATSGTDVTKGVGVNGVAGVTGGSGGIGNWSGGYGGQAGTAGTVTSTPANTPRLSVAAYMLEDTGGIAFTSSAGTGGSSGGGGGGDGNEISDTAGGGGGGGGAGCAGGYVSIFAKKIVVGASGSILAPGGDGGNGGNGGNASGGGATPAGGGGGGGAGSGGSGGVILLVYSNLSNSGTIEATGGSAGSVGTGGSGIQGGGNGGNGTAGNAGTTGTTIQLQI